MLLASGSYIAFDVSAMLRMSNRQSAEAVVCAGNMMLFDKDGVIRRYESPEAILTEFFELRMEYYSRRRLLLIQVV